MQGWCLMVRSDLIFISNMNCYCDSFCSDKGTVYHARAYKIPECSRTAAGTPLVQVVPYIWPKSLAHYLFQVLINDHWFFFSLVQILSLSDGERVTSIIPVSEFEGDQYLVMLTMKGYIKKISLNYFSSIRSTGIIAIQLVSPLLCCFCFCVLAVKLSWALINLLKLIGSWWWAEMGEALLEWWLCGYGLTEWNGDFVPLWECKLTFLLLSLLSALA